MQRLNSEAAKLRNNSTEGLATDEPRKPTAIVALLFTAAVVAVPWPRLYEEAHGTPYEDRSVYLDQITGMWLRFDLPLVRNPVDYLTDEYLWGWLLNLLIRQLEIPAETAMLMISSVIVFVSARLVVESAPNRTLILLVNPVFIDFAFSQMRLALALAVLGWAYLARPKWRWTMIPAIVASAFIHTSAPVFGLMYVFARLLGTKAWAAKPAVQCSAALLSGIVGATLFGPFRSVVLAPLSDRRTSFIYASSSPEFYLFWVALLIVFVVSWDSLRTAEAGRLGVSGVTWVVAAAIFGGYPDRVLAGMLPFIVVGIAKVMAPLRGVAVVGYAANNLILWLLWSHSI